MLGLKLIFFAVAAGCRVLEKYIEAHGSENNKPGLRNALFTCEMLAFVVGVFFVWTDHIDNQRESRVRDALDDDIRFLKIEVALKGPVSFQEICPFAAVAEFHMPGGFNPRGFSISAVDLYSANAASGTNRSPAYSMQVASLTGDLSRFGYSYMPWQSNVSTVVIPISLDSAVRTVEKVRDLRDVQFSPFLSRTVLNHAKEIRLVANDLVLLRIDPLSTEWEERPFTRPPLSNTNSLRLGYPRKDDWIIDLKKARESIRPIHRHELENISFKAELAAPPK
jgi:hypothetical protein